MSLVLLLTFLQAVLQDGEVKVTVNESGEQNLELLLVPFVFALCFWNSVRLLMEDRRTPRYVLEEEIVGLKLEIDVLDDIVRELRESK